MARRSNCFIASLVMVWRLRRRRGRWWVRRADHFPIGWHWGWQSRDQRYTLHYEPLEPAPMPRAIWHKVWYEGVLTRGDLRKE